MLFFDECIPEEVTAALRLLLVPVTDVRIEELQGRDDADIVAAAKARNAIFVTYDMDFTTTRPLVAAMAKAGVCVVLIRRSKVKGPSRSTHLPETALLVLRHYAEDWLEKCSSGPVIISCSLRGGSRARPLSTLPWFLG